jgi:hypothetical protein
MIDSGSSVIDKLRDAMGSATAARVFGEPVAARRRSAEQADT